MQRDAAAIVDILVISRECAAASHSCLVPRELHPAPLQQLVVLGEAYKRLLAGLPLLTVLSRPGGGHSVALLPFARYMPLICFAPPYLAAARNGRELRYPLIGGLAVDMPGGYLAIGLGLEGAAARIWVDVVGFRPRLGLGPLYLLTQAQVHRLLTITFLRRLGSAR